MSKFSNLIQKQKETLTVKKQHFNLEAQTNSNRVENCPCGSKKSYKFCCGICHNDITNAILPVDLMKSRYTAYTLGDIEYLLKSHHISTRPTSEADEILAWAKSVKWMSLEIIKAEKPSKNEGFVTFKANFIENNEKNVIFETSRFVKENNYWTYIDGKHL